MKIINGQYQGRKGVIKFIVKNVIFLWDREFYQTNGIFVVKSRDVLILGEEHMKEKSGAFASNNRRLRDPLIGKDVEITKG